MRAARVSETHVGAESLARCQRLFIFAALRGGKEKYARGFLPANNSRYRLGSRRPQLNCAISTDENHS